MNTEIEEVIKQIQFIAVLIKEIGERRPNSVSKLYKVSASLSKYREMLEDEEESKWSIADEQADCEY